jgi:C4-dicarboxylate transporter
MELELALGRDVGAMPERDFRRWIKYSNRKALPLRRLELYLAQIAMLIAHTMGGSEAPLASFLFDPKAADEPVTKVAMQELKQAFGFAPRRRGHG